MNRGFAVHGDRLYKLTLDMHLLALEMKTGKVLWDVEVDSWRKANAGTGAPLIVKDKILVGNAGGDIASRGFVDAYDFTGQARVAILERAAADEPGGDAWPAAERPTRRRGGLADRHLRSRPEPGVLAAWQPEPGLRRNNPAGATISTATRSWRLTQTRASCGGISSSRRGTSGTTTDRTPVLADLTIGGTPRKVVMHANRNGFFYVLDRTNGQFLHRKALQSRK